MHNIEFVTLPIIPDEIVLHIYSSLANPNELKHHPYQQVFSVHDCHPIVYEFMRDSYIAGPGQLVQVQRISGLLPVHIDARRLITTNYLLETGGENVITSFYKNENDTNPTDSQCLPIRSWHRLNVQNWHGVVGVAPGYQRIAVCVFTQERTIHTTRINQSSAIESISKHH